MVANSATRRVLATGRMLFCAIGAARLASGRPHSLIGTHHGSCIGSAGLGLRALRTDVGATVLLLRPSCLDAGTAVRQGSPLVEQLTMPQQRLRSLPLLGGSALAARFRRGARARGGRRVWQHGGMCTVVARWSGESPTQILALRDELTSRAFDDPGRWWPQLPQVLGGRDRTAGGTWCASNLDSGGTALVLNRPRKRLADPGAPSRGLLPLLAVEHELDWTSHVTLDGMASFALVLVLPGGLFSWVFDGAKLVSEEHWPGTHMFTSGGAEDGKADRYLTRFAEADLAGWRAVLEQSRPTDDAAALIVRRQRHGRVFATVFGQLIETVPGRLHVEYTRQPWHGGEWEKLDLP